MRILVAGGAGYTGFVLVPHLLEREYDVDVLDLLWFGSYLLDGVRVIEKDVMFITEDNVKGYDQVIFIAGLSNSLIPLLSIPRRPTPELVQ